MLVVHGYERYTLLLTDPQIDGPRSFVAQPVAGELRQGWHRANSRRLESARYLPPSVPDPRAIQEALALTPQVVVEAFESQPFFVLVIPPVEEELTAVLSPAWKVDTINPPIKRIVNLQIQTTSRCGLFCQPGTVVNLFQFVLICDPA